jgi:hypothetical protein
MKKPDTPARRANQSKNYCLGNSDEIKNHGHKTGPDIANFSVISATAGTVIAAGRVSA